MLPLICITDITLKSSACYLYKPYELLFGCFALLIRIYSFLIVLNGI